MILYETDIERLSQIQEYITSNLEKDLRTGSIARKFAIDKYKLSRHFLQHFAIPIGQYILNHRMALAYELLANKKMPVCEVATKVGYNDRSGFSHAFSSYFGMSPREMLSRT